MESHDDYYSLKGTVQNLMLMKLAFDYGVDLKKFPHYVVNYDFGQEYDWDIFMHTVNSVFTIVDYWFPHSGEEEIPDKTYWCERAGLSHHHDDLEGTGIIVILDDRIDHTKIRSGTIGGGADFYCGYGEITSIENGVILTWYEDDGPIDLVDVLYVLLDILPTRKEQESNAVAI
ncbi:MULTISPECIES: hypothetical protein [Bacillota]|uniref:hypothetical protein n=1 Tax=Bacillota TaxID=1239 RepID=UPI0039EF490A